MTSFQKWVEKITAVWSTATGGSKGFRRTFIFFQFPHGKQQSLQTPRRSLWLGALRRQDSVDYVLYGKSLSARRTQTSKRALQYWSNNDLAAFLDKNGRLQVSKWAACSLLISAQKWHLAVWKNCHRVSSPSHTKFTVLIALCGDSTTAVLVLDLECRKYYLFIPLVVMVASYYNCTDDILF